MTAIDRIVAVRTVGEVISDSVDRGYARTVDAAAAFGLSMVPDVYRPISRSEAVEVLAAVIHEDMAYGIEIVPLERARELASAFVDGFPRNEARFFTNGNFGRPLDVSMVGPQWSSATDATFDAGVLVLTSQSTACLWFKDEN